MAFKNALKLLISKFRYVWVILLYLVITGVIVGSLSLPFAVPILRVLREDGILNLFAALFDGRGGSFDAWTDNLYAALSAAKDSILGNRLIAFSTGALVLLVFTFAYRFILGLYEIPLVTVLEGAMSSNARIGFTGRFISRIGGSACFVLVKMIYTVLFDALIGIALVLMIGLFDVPMLKLFVPFLIMSVLLVLLAIRYSLIAMWAPHIVLGGCGIFRSFAFSVQKGFRNMGSIFSTFLIAWTLIIALNMLVGVFTFCAGLILTVPLSMLFVNLLNMTLYYGKNGKRYYVDAATVVTPPVIQKT